MKISNDNISIFSYIFAGVSLSILILQIAIVNLWVVPFWVVITSYYIWLSYGQPEVFGIKQKTILTTNIILISLFLIPIFVKYL